MAILKGMIGFLLLVAGCHSYWLLVGCAGFLLGDFVALQFYHVSGELRQIFVAMQYGIVSGIVSLFVKKIAVPLAGFLIAGYLYMTFPETIGWGIFHFSWVLFVIAGLIGAGLILAVYAYGLIVLSTFAGATLILQAARFGRLPRLFSSLFCFYWD
jgi:hypothetical protein